MNNHELSPFLHFNMQGFCWITGSWRVYTFNAQRQMFLTVTCQSLSDIMVGICRCRSRLPGNIMVEGEKNETCVRCY